MIEWAPTVMVAADVVQVAVPVDAPEETVWAVQPVMVVPPSLKATVPVIGKGRLVGVTVAV